MGRKLGLMKLFILLGLLGVAICFLLWDKRITASLMVLVDGDDR